MTRMVRMKTDLISEYPSDQRYQCSILRVSISL